MIKSRSYYIITLVLGIAMLGASQALRLDGMEGFLSLIQLKSISGVLLGVGAGLAGMSVSNLIMCHIQQKEPAIKRQNEIDYHDERNVAIRNKSKAKSADITQWLIMGIAYLNILLGSPAWLILIIVGVFIFYHILCAFYMIKYQNEM